MYVKIANGAEEQYPYTLGNLRRDNPNTSFPRKISAETLASYNLYVVTTQDVPSYDERTQEVELAEQPSLVDGNWVIVTSVVDKTAEQIADYDLGHASGNRMRRDDLLSKTDWWALPDSPTMTSEQTAYRQALRDITSHANWPHLEEADWPTKP